MNKTIAVSTEDMQVLGKELSKQLLSGDVLLLSGAMGSGKSELCRGIARGLGIAGPVTSPTFTILNLYDEGIIPFHHFDLYRINSWEELLESGLDEFMGGDSITAIEWHERAPNLMSKDCLEISISFHEDGSCRVIEFLPRGTFRALDYEILGHQHRRGNR
ncbi:MAG: tRNA (adenosine(37)-N6)-threonylcarbamoyltransferase complex ATPase subunit type 1 TsaE [Clostridiales bacterium]|nr:tRNA (adenosine(37)-N6)-threonylcarbamoyltransferase complex ATPase subunit type 1 TsaE [Clostridiales bacterium]